MNDFKFMNKGDTLESLRHLLNTAKILDQFLFSVGEWKENPQNIIGKIQSFFKSEVIIVRSSSLQEDTIKNSNAGKYESVLNVNKNDPEMISKAIDTVNKSYLKDKETNLENKILIQPQLQGVLISGVILTRCPYTGGPYYILNYDKVTNKTNSVTGGHGNLETFTFFKYLENTPSDINLTKIILMAKELEEITGYDSLDIEFAINENGLYLLQVRPLITSKKPDKFLDINIEITIKKIKEFIKSSNQKFPNLHGYKALFGLMPDWNPAEIIGECPKPLAFSLYREIITDFIWPLSRKEIGYKDVGYHPGVTSLGGKPYVDVRLSFNTFLPFDLSEPTSEKLVNFYIDKLINNPHLHDKIEFEIAYTCYKVGFEKEEGELKQNNFSQLQIKEIKKTLLDLTNNIIENSPYIIEKELELVDLLNEKRKKIIESDINKDIKMSQLIHDCKFYGTLPFSKLARFAFIGNIIFSSLIENNTLSLEDKENFFKSVNSVATDFVNDLNLLKECKINKEKFLEKYGHLRPGTYDLCSNTYKEKFDDYFILNNLSKKEGDYFFEFNLEKKQKIEKALLSSGFKIGFDKFIEFVKISLMAREKAKFEFTKNLSLILDYCYEYLKDYNFNKEDITFLEIQDIVSFSHKSKPVEEIGRFKKKIIENKDKYDILQALRLPPLIYMEKNAEYFHQFDNKPNYITNKIITSDIIYLKEGTPPGEIENKIVIITNADPGYDWIFGHNIRGLITKYGGVASHMSIRCAEFGLPAAIGCGVTIFEHLKKFKKIELNCTNKQIKGIL